LKVKEKLRNSPRQGGAEIKKLEINLSHHSDDPPAGGSKLQVKS